MRISVLLMCMAVTRRGQGAVQGALASPRNIPRSASLDGASTPARPYGPAHEQLGLQFSPRHATIARTCLSLTAAAISALLIAAALFLMYEIGRLVGEKTTADKFPDAKKAAVQRSRSVLGGMFAEQLAPYPPNFPFSPTEAKFIGAPIDFLVFKGMDAQPHR